MTEPDAWAGLADAFAGYAATVKGRVRRHVLHEHLLAHAPPPPATVVDVGGGAGDQSLPLARLGHPLTIVDRSAAMLAKAAERLAGEPADVRDRVRLVQASGEDAPAALGGARFDVVLCHGVVMYVEDPAPLLTALCDLAAAGGLVSVVALNQRTLAMRPALEGRWADALAAFDARTEVGVLGLPTRADTVAELSALLERDGVAPVAWYGVWLFTDAWQGPVPEDLTDVLAVELAASRRDPYRGLSRLFHLVGRRD